MARFSPVALVLLISVFAFTLVRALYHPLPDPLLSQPLPAAPTSMALGEEDEEKEEEWKAVVKITRAVSHNLSI